MPLWVVRRGHLCVGRGRAAPSSSLVLFSSQSFWDQRHTKGGSFTHVLDPRQSHRGSGKVGQMRRCMARVAQPYVRFVGVITSFNVFEQSGSIALTARDADYSQWPVGTRSVTFTGANIHHNYGWREKAEQNSSPMYFLHGGQPVDVKMDPSEAGTDCGKSAGLRVFLDPTAAADVVIEHGTISLRRGASRVSPVPPEATAYYGVLTDCASWEQWCSYYCSLHLLLGRNYAERLDNAGFTERERDLRTFLREEDWCELQRTSVTIEDVNGIPF